MCIAYFLKLLSCFICMTRCSAITIQIAAMVRMSLYYGLINYPGTKYNAIMLIHSYYKVAPPGNKVHVAQWGPFGADRTDPYGPYVGPMNRVIWAGICALVEIDPGFIKLFCTMVIYQKYIYATLPISSSRVEYTMDAYNGRNIYNNTQPRRTNTQIVWVLFAWTWYLSCLCINFITVV